MSRSFRLALLSLLLVPAAAALPVRAQSFPAHPLTLVVPYPPGGSADVLARAVGQKLGEKLGRGVVIENRGGAGTAIGARFVAEAPADGYTLLMGTVSSHAINPAMTKVGYDAVHDFAVVAPIGSIPFVLVTRPDSPYHSVGDVIAAAKANPGAIGYASAGPGTSNHLAGEMLAHAAGIKLLHVPYRGSAPALTDVLAGRVPLMFDLVTTSLGHIRQGALRPLAVTSATRSALLPDVPTFAQSGVPDFEVGAWFAVFAPARVPALVLATLSADVAAVLAEPDMRKKLADLGVEPDTRSPAEFAAYVQSEARKYADVVKRAGLAP